MAGQLSTEQTDRSVHHRTVAYDAAQGTVGITRWHPDPEPYYDRVMANLLCSLLMHELGAGGSVAVRLYFTQPDSHDVVRYQGMVVNMDLSTIWFADDTSVDYTRGLLAAYL